MLLTSFVRRLGRWICLAGVLCGLGGAPTYGRPAQADTFRAYLPMVVGPQPAAAPAGPSSAELIGAALARGEISPQAALAYRAYAAFGDPRLPAPFQGAAGDDDSLLGDLAAGLGQLSPQAQAGLRPFLLPPYHAGSWWDARNGPAGLAADATVRVCDSLEKDIPLTSWRSVESIDGKVRVWWQVRHPEDSAKAEAYAKAVGGIWRSLAALMGREPPSDGGDRLSCRGGDDRLDISLVALHVPGLVAAYGSTADGPAPSYMLIDRAEGAQVGQATLIHELMHVFQNGFKITSYNEYRWWKEATAQWAIHYVEKQGLGTGTDYEHESAQHWLTAPELSLETWTDAGHQYGSYLLPFSLQARGENAGGLVRQSFERAGTFTNSLQNLNGLLPGGFDQQLPEFTMYNLNRVPVDRYLRHDALTAAARYTSEHAPQLSGDPYRSYPLDGKVGHLASHAFHFKFSDPTVRAVLFENPYPRSDAPTAHVRAIYQIDGAWTIEDWTDKPWVPFCRDLRAERVTDLTVVISNSEWRDREHVLRPITPPKLHATNMGCRGWQVEASVKATYKGQSINELESVTAEATMLLDRDPKARYLTETYRAASGTATWSHEGERSNCTGKGGGSYPVAEAPDGSVAAIMQVDVYGVSFQGSYTYDGSRRYRGVAGNSIGTNNPIRYVCPNYSFLEPLVHHSWLVTGPTAQNTQVSRDGQTISGTYTETSTDVGATIRRVYTWKMKALPPE